MIQYPNHDCPWNFANSMDPYSLVIFMQYKMELNDLKQATIEANWLPCHSRLLRCLHFLDPLLLQSMALTQKMSIRGCHLLE